MYTGNSLVGVAVSILVPTILVSVFIPGIPRGRGRRHLGRGLRPVASPVNPLAMARLVMAALTLALLASLARSEGESGDRGFTRGRCGQSPAVDLTGRNAHSHTLPGLHLVV